MKTSIEFAALREGITKSLSQAMNPYAAFSKPFDRDEYLRNLIANGFGDDHDLDDPEALFEAFMEDIRDDKHNCGGNPFTRMDEALLIMPLLSSEHQEHLQRFMATWIVDDAIPHNGEYDHNWDTSKKYF